tara:strand:+ start:212 stop:406 length:195 start_codon:yes stop_codon:yes gene_type:complete
VAVVKTDVCEEDFQKRNATPIRRVGVTNTDSTGGANAFSAGRVLAGSPGAGAGSIVFSGVCKDF